jgi:GTP cyclohydrolase FolE2
MVAGVVEEFPGLEDDAFVEAHQRNFETIHAHDVIAERTGLLGELRCELAGGDGGAHGSLADWLRS